MDSKPGWNGVWRLVLSARVTAALFVAFLLLFVAGIVVPQAPITTEGVVGAFAERWPRIAELADTLGWNDVYRSPWMYAVFGLFTLQLLVYIVRRARSLLRSTTGGSVMFVEQMSERRQVPIGLHSLMPVCDVLRERRYRVDDDGDRVIARKSRLSPFWGLVFHASFIVILGGAWILRATDFRAAAAVTEGQIFRGQPHEFASIGGPIAPDRVPAGLGFAVESIEPAFGEHGVATDVVVTLRRADESRGELRVNQPLSVAGVDVLIKNFGIAPVFEVWDVRTETGRCVDVFSPRLPCWSSGLPEDAFQLLHPPAWVDARFYPDVVEGPDGLSTASMNLGDAAIALRFRPDDTEQQWDGGLLRVGESLRVGDFELRLAEFRVWGDFLFSRQSGVVLMIGFLLMVGGALMRLLFPRREIVAELRGRGAEAELVVGGEAEFFPMSFRWELDEIVEELRSSEQATDVAEEVRDGQD